jgi:7-carboxy-7-deazaguanine synthase
MKEAKVSEIFLSYQGEGTFLGSRQIFIRFYGCNLKCIFCDTSLEKYKTFTKEELLDKVLDFGDDYNEVSITGGEPLLYADFLKDFLTIFKAQSAKKIYLETNGTLAEGLKKVGSLVDIIAMDFKLPSSTKDKTLVWEAHREFLKAVGGQELILKAVITDATSIEDIKTMTEIIAEANKTCTIVLQPVTPIEARVKESDREMVSFFKGYIEKETSRDVMIMGQAHKLVGIK